MHQLKRSIYIRNRSMTCIDLEKINIIWKKKSKLRISQSWNILCHIECGLNWRHRIK